MDVQRDVLETEVWEVHYHVVVLDLARKAVSLPGDHTPEGLLDFGIGNLFILVCQSNFTRSLKRLFESSWFGASKGINLSKSG